MKSAEEHINSKVLGIRGGVDVMFIADFYPENDTRPELKETREVVLELKTGYPQVKHEHQTLCYMMVNFGVNIFGNIGFVLYSNMNVNNEYNIKVVEPGVRDFMQMVLHRNLYVLNPKFYEQYIQ